MGFTVELTTAVGGVSAAVALLGAIRAIAKGLAGDWSEFNRRRLKHAQACLAACEPGSEMATFARGICDEETFRQLVGNVPSPRIAKTIRELRSGGEFTMTEIRLAIRQLPYDAVAIDDERNLLASKWDIGAGALQAFLGLLLIGVGALAVPSAMLVSDYWVVGGAILAGLALVLVCGRIGFRGKHALDAARRLAVAAAKLDQQATAVAIESVPGVANPIEIKDGDLTALNGSPPHQLPKDAVST